MRMALWKNMFFYPSSCYVNYMNKQMCQLYGKYDLIFDPWQVHSIYYDVPGVQQYINQLIRKNEDERTDWKEAFNNAQADILSHEVFYGNEPMDDKRYIG